VELVTDRVDLTDRGELVSGNVSPLFYLTEERERKTERQRKRRKRETDRDTERGAEREKSRERRDLIVFN